MQLFTFRSRLVEVGTKLAQLIDELYDQGYLHSYKHVNIIGHSLGAHVAGIAGRATKQKVGSKLGLKEKNYLEKNLCDEFKFQ